MKKQGRGGNTGTVLLVIGGLVVGYLVLTGGAGGILSTLGSLAGIATGTSVGSRLLGGGKKKDDKGGKGSGSKGGGDDSPPEAPDYPAGFRSSSVEGTGDIGTKGKPTTGSKGTRPEDQPEIKKILDQQIQQPSKTQRVKKSDIKAPRKTNPPKTKAKPKQDPKDCGIVDLGIFKIQNPICSLEKLVGLRPSTLAEQYSSTPKPEIASEPLIVPGAI